MWLAYRHAESTLAELPVLELPDNQYLLLEIMMFKAHLVMIQRNLKSANPYARKTVSSSSSRVVQGTFGYDTAQERQPLCREE